MYDLYTFLGERWEKDGEFQQKERQDQKKGADFHMGDACFAAFTVVDILAGY